MSNLKHQCQQASDEFARRFNSDDARPTLVDLYADHASLWVSTDQHPGRDAIKSFWDGFAASGAEGLSLETKAAARVDVPYSDRVEERGRFSLQMNGKEMTGEYTVIYEDGKIVFDAVSPDS